MLIKLSAELGITLCSILSGCHSDRSKSPLWTGFPPHINFQAEKEQHIQWRVFEKSRELLCALNRHILEVPKYYIGLYRYLHVILVFMWYLGENSELLKHLHNDFHPELIVPILNHLLRECRAKGGETWNLCVRSGFPQRSSPLPEDWLMRGCPWAPEARAMSKEIFHKGGEPKSMDLVVENPDNIYFPSGWFENDCVSSVEKRHNYSEPNDKGSIGSCVRLVWLAHKLAAKGKSFCKITDGESWRFETLRNEDIQLLEKPDEDDGWSLSAELGFVEY